jgi:DNA mismatch repair ATPase MutS
MIILSRTRTEETIRLSLVWRGNVYEAFDSDAYVIARVCGLTLKRRSRGEKLHDVAEFPARELNANIQKLKAQGYEVELREDIQPRLP